MSVSVSFRELLQHFVTRCFLCGGALLAPNPQAGEPPLVECPRLLVQYLSIFPPYLVHPQPEDAPCVIVGTN